MALFNEGEVFLIIRYDCQSQVERENGGTTVGKQDPVQASDRD